MRRHVGEGKLTEENLHAETGQIGSVMRKQAYFGTPTSKSRTSSSAWIFQEGIEDFDSAMVAFSLT